MKAIKFQNKLLTVFFIFINLIAFGQSNWVSGTLYTSGTQVIYNSLVFQANADVTEQNKYLTPRDNQIVWEVQWTNGNSWVQGIEYKIGMLVTNQGANYVASQDILSANAYTEPRYLPSMWTLQWLNNDEWINGLSYLSGMIVTFNNILFQATSNITNTGASPINNCSEWSVLWTNGSEWVNSLCYKADMIVLYNGVTYKAKQDISNVGANPFNNYNEWDLIWNNGDLWIIDLSYKQGMIVLYNGFQYEALQNITNKNVPPNNNISEWQVLADDTESENQFEGYFETSIVPSDGYITGFSGADQDGYWSKVASVKVKEQYFQATMILEFVGGTSGSDNLPSDVGFAEILFRVKQQLPFPTDPYIQLEMISSNNSKKLKATDFKAKLVSVNGSGSTGETYVELYVRVVPPWEQLKFSCNRLSFFDPTKVEVNIYNESDFVESVTGNLFDCISFDGDPQNELIIEHFATADEQTALLIDVNRAKTKAISVLDNRDEEVFRVTGNGIVSSKKVYAEEFEVKLNALDMWYDHVFAEEYNLMTIKELQTFVIENKHLPDIPSEKEVKENGFELGEMNALLLKKIEELTLYIIQLEKRIDELEESK